MKKSIFTLVGIATIMLMMVAGFSAGWCMNVYKLSQCDFKPTYKAEVIRAIGVAVPPVGAVAGWLTIEDTKEEE